MTRQNWGCFSRCHSCC